MKLSKLTIAIWALIIGLCCYGHYTDTKIEVIPFPKPDPKKGVPLGYDFNTKEYRYHSDNPNTSIKLEKPCIEPVDLSDDDIYDILDYTLD